jgi:hypothetical protein
MTAEMQVLASVNGDRHLARPEALQRELCDWLTANGIDPDDVLARPGVAVVLLDGPGIWRREVIRTADGKTQLGEDGDIASRVVVSALRVPLPDHLADPA